MGTTTMITLRRLLGVAVLSAAAAQAQQPGVTWPASASGAEARHHFHHYCEREAPTANATGAGWWPPCGQRERHGGAGTGQGSISGSAG